MAAEDPMTFYLSVHAAITQSHMLVPIGTVRDGPRLQNADVADAMRENGYVAGETAYRHAQRTLVGAMTKTAFAIQGAAEVAASNVSVVLADAPPPAPDTVPPPWVAKSCTAAEFGWAGDHADLLDAVQRVAVPAAFGDLTTQTTVFDSAVRLAWEVPFPHARIRVSTTLPHRFLDAPVLPIHDRRDEGLLAIARIVALSLLHVDAHNVTLQPLKLNLYTVGGHFEPHTDTPVAPNMVGTLVLLLPSDCEGGELEIQPPLTCPGREPLVCRVPPVGAPLQWVAFFGDCKHVVKPVTRGYRISYTFAVLQTTPEWKRASVHAPGQVHLPVPEAMRETAEKEQTEKEEKKRLEEQEIEEQEEYLENMSSTQMQALEWGLREPFVLPQRVLALTAHAHLGILLRHTYTLNVTWECLKGVDRVLANALRLQYPSCQLSPVLYNYRASRDADESCEEDPGTRSDVVLPFSAAVLARLRAATAATATKHSAGRWVKGRWQSLPSLDAWDLPPFSFFGREPISFITLNEPQPGTPVVTECEVGGNTGNEAVPSDDNIVYLCCALLVPRDGFTAADSADDASESAGSGGGAGDASESAGETRENTGCAGEASVSTESAVEPEPSATGSGIAGT